jgi:hypothetical protein
MIFNTILTILGTASVMNLIHETPIYHRVLERLKLNRKPMSCIMCSTFWVTFGYTVITNPSQSIFIAGCAAVAAELINIQLHKL